MQIRRLLTVANTDRSVHRNRNNWTPRSRQVAGSFALVPAVGSDCVLRDEDGVHPLPAME